MRSPDLESQPTDSQCAWSPEPVTGRPPVLEDEGLSQVCPNCRRVDSLLVIGDVTYCAACGYASDGARGCT